MFSLITTTGASTVAGRPTVIDMNQLMRDADGNTLSGSNSFRMRLPAETSQRLPTGITLNERVQNDDG